MRRWTGSALLSCGIACAGDIAPLDIKAGQWETTLRTQVSGTPEAAVFPWDERTPEQRAKLRDWMKAHEKDRRPGVTKSTCIRKEDLNTPITFGAVQSSCTRTVLTSSKTGQEILIECAGGGTQKGTAHIEVLDATHVKGTVQRSMEQNGRTIIVASTFDSKWRGSTCGQKAEQ